MLKHDDWGEDFTSKLQQFVVICVSGTQRYAVKVNFMYSENTCLRFDRYHVVFLGFL